MSQKKKIVVFSLIGLLFVAAVFVVLKNNNKSVQESTRPAPAVATAKVSIKSSGFFPGTVKVKVNSDVLWTNEDSAGHSVVSNPHPSHTDLPGLNSKANISQNGTYSYRFDTAGTYKYHDDVNPTFNGVVIVEN